MHVHLFLAVVLLYVTQTVAAQSVALSGVAGGKALVVIDGSAPRFMSPGQTHMGVTLVETVGNSATLSIAGQRQTLQVGSAPVSVGSRGAAAGSGQRIVMTADTRGHFMPQGQINGKPVQFMVDTDATGIGIGAPEARRINLKYEQGQRVQLNTANGKVIGYVIRLDSVRIGDVMIYEVDAVVSPESMPFVLLGNSYLNRFQIQRTNDQLTLDKRF